MKSCWLQVREKMAGWTHPQTCRRKTGQLNAVWPYDGNTSGANCGGTGAKRRYPAPGGLGACRASPLHANTASSTRLLDGLKSTIAASVYSLPHGGITAAPSRTLASWQPCFFRSAPKPVLVRGLLGKWRSPFAADRRLFFRSWVEVLNFGAGGASGRYARPLCDRGPRDSDAVAA
jgi:hypothetical protein